MDPMIVVEVIVASALIVLIVVTFFLLPPKLGKKRLYIVISLIALILLFFTIRPLVYDYQVSQKKEYLTDYLESKYSNQKWKITKREGRHYNSDFFEVKFENETDWIYLYSVTNEKSICQRGWIPPNNQLSREGKHYDPCSAN